MARERTQRVARNRAFFNGLSLIIRQTPQQALPRGANDFAAVNLLCLLFYLENFLILMEAFY